METITKKELLQNFEDQEFIQINFPKVSSYKNDWNRTETKVEISDDTILHMRSKVQNLDHFNTVYRDGNKYYLEESVEAAARLCKRVFRPFYKNAKDVEYDFNDLEEAEYCLFIADYDMKKAVEIMRRRV